MRSKCLFVVFLALVLSLALSEIAIAGNKRKEKTIPTSAPDLTKGGNPDDILPRYLGPLDIYGWLFARSTGSGASRDARQILVTDIGADGSAAGVLKVGDVILGAGKEVFSRDARKALAEAINVAETTENQGQLLLEVWRAGKTMEVTLTLPVLGTFSETAPYDCEKTDRLVEMACAYLIDKPLKSGWSSCVTALGLLATGREDVLPKVSRFAQKICKPGEVLSIETHVPMMCWQWTYKLLFLSEYYLLTKDNKVLPTIKEYATKLAMGQSGVGTWGHTVAAIANSGKLHGHLGGYGAINQMGLTAMIALALAEKCGVQHSEITQALKRGETFFSHYIGKGTIPYGDHAPAKEMYDDNGKSGSAAILFDLLDNKGGKAYFSNMVLGSAPNGREAGHCGHFWSHLWGGMGAARSGRDGMIAFAAEMRAINTLDRNPSGGYAYQQNIGEWNKNGRKGSSTDRTGARLLELCIPRARLYITGRDMTDDNPVSPKRIGVILRAGALAGDRDARKKLKKDEIVELLSDPLPASRHVGVQALKEQELKYTDKLVAMLSSRNRFARYGACNALREAGYASRSAVRKLASIMTKSKDLQFRLLAIDALCGKDPKRGLSAAATPAIPALLKLAVSKSTDDPRRVLQRKLGYALFYSGSSMGGMKGLLVRNKLSRSDRKLLVPAIKELLTVDDGRSRGAVKSIYPKLTEKELKTLWPDIYRATRDLAPSGIMFADSIRIAGLELMEKNSILEGVELCASILSENRWGKGKRQESILPILARYGTEASSALPAVKSLLTRVESAGKKKKKKQRADKAKKTKEKVDSNLKQIDQTLQAIEKGRKRELISIKSLLKRE